MENIKEIMQPEKIQRYAVYSERHRLEDGHIFTRSFIVIKNGYGVIERFTRFHEYAGIYDKRTYRPLQSNPEAKLYYICSMLNYILVANGKRFGIRHVFEITKPMLKEFFDAYALEKTKDDHFRSEQTVERCISAVTAFMARLSKKYAGYMKLSAKDLYEEHTHYTKQGREVTRKVPAFQAVGLFESEGIFRDIPTKAIEILIPLAFRFTPEIAFGICLQAFAGLRAGEVCNVRQECSPLGAGIRFTEIDGIVKAISIDLTKELALRSDGAEVGKIKKERVQKVYPLFIGTFQKAYEFHKRFLKKVSYEKEYAPMFVNSHGFAMSYESYRTKFKRLVNEYLRPLLVQNKDPELRIYGQMLYENQLGTHSLRHWYTVQLVLNGEGIEGIQSWRGDRSPESAFSYLKNKGDLVKELQAANENLMSALLEIGGEYFEQRN